MGQNLSKKFKKSAENSKSAQQATNKKPVNHCIWTSLHLASHENNLDLVHSLIKDGTNINATDSSGRTPLHVAANDGYVGVARLLIEKGANVNCVDVNDGWTPLHIACDRNYIEIARLLLDNGANIFAKTKRGQYPWTIALDKCHAELCFMLKEVYRQRRPETLPPRQQKKAFLRRQQERKKYQAQRNQAKNTSTTKNPYEYVF